MSYFAGKQKSELGDGRWLGQIQQGGFVFGIKSDQAGHGGAWSIQSCLDNPVDLVSEKSAGLKNKPDC